MYHRIMWNVDVYQIFSKIGLVDQSKTVHTNIFANNRKFPRFPATINCDFEKNDYFRHVSP